MKTKSGKSHFTCEFRTYDSSGKLKYEHLDHSFIALNAEDYINRSVKRYGAHGYTAEFKNVVNLDEEK